MGRGILRFATGRHARRPLQGVCAQPGTGENPGLRADFIRPYGSSEEPATIHPTAQSRKWAGRHARRPLQWAGTLNRVLAKIRGCGRILSAPTVRVGEADSTHPAAQSHKWASTLSRVLAKIRGCGRILSAPTVWVGKLVSFTEPRCSHNVRADSIRPYRQWAALF